MTQHAIWIDEDPNDDRTRNANIRETLYALERQYGAEAVREQAELVFANDAAFEV